MDPFFKKIGLVCKRDHYKALVDSFCQQVVLSEDNVLIKKYDYYTEVFFKKTAELIIWYWDGESPFHGQRFDKIYVFFPQEYEKSYLRAVLGHMVLEGLYCIPNIPKDDKQWYHIFKRPLGYEYQNYIKTKDDCGRQIVYELWRKPDNADYQQIGIFTTKDKVMECLTEREKEDRLSLEGCYYYIVGAPLNANDPKVMEFKIVRDYPSLKTE